MYQVNESDKNLYWENGYLLIENLFEESEIEDYYFTLQKHVDQEWSNMLNPDRYEFLLIHNAEKIHNFKLVSEKIKYLSDCKKSAKKIRNFLKDKRITSILEDLYQKKMIGLSTHMIWKKPGTKNSNQAWNPHQDNAYAQNENGLLVTINLFLDQVTEFNGAIYNYPGSHKEGLLPTDQSNSYKKYDNPGKLCEVPENYIKNDLFAKKGSLYIQHGNLIHGSYGNQTQDTTRAMLSATYLVENEKFLPGKEAFRKKINLD